MGFVLVFDLPRNLAVERVRLHRELTRLGAKNVQHSLWSHDDLNSLMKLGIEIRKLGGRAKILEERFLF